MPRTLRETDTRRKTIIKKYADKRAANTAPKYKVGQNVLILRKESGGKILSKWEKTIYKVISQNGASVVVSNNGRYYRRNVSHLRPYYANTKAPEKTINLDGTTDRSKRKINRPVKYADYHLG